jgi:hypothetical protein
VKAGEEKVEELKSAGAEVNASAKAVRVLH